jgi:hypothetical protein
MLTYLLGDVMRIFSGDFKEGEVSGMQGSQAMWLGLSALMLVPIVMLFLSITLPHPVARWANIVVPILLFIFNAVGLPGYVGTYDKFLIAVSLVWNALTVWYAWMWR